MRAGEYGVELQIESSVDLSTATALALLIGNPTGTVVAKSLSVPGTPQTSVTYITQSTDFPTTGLYTLELRADFGATRRLLSKIDRYYVDLALTVSP
jgi:hypothetical protein